MTIELPDLPACVDQEQEPFDDEEEEEEEEQKREPPEEDEERPIGEPIEDRGMRGGT